jgi:hypothetical protein
MLPRLGRERECCVNPSQCCFHILPLGLKFGEQTLIERQIQLVSSTGTYL